MGIETLGPARHCYRVRLRPTNGVRDRANCGGVYLEVLGGECFVIEDDAEDVARLFPEALEITRVGIGYREDGERDG